MRKKNEISLSWGKKNRVKRLASSFSVFLGGLETSSPPLERRRPRRREKRSRLQAGPPLTSTGGGDEGTHAVWFFFLLSLLRPPLPSFKIEINAYY